MNKSALFQLIIAMAIFGSVGFFSTLTGLPAMELVWIRCICAAVFLCIAWIVTGSFKRERWDRKELVRIACCGMTNVLNWVFLFKAFEATSITIAITLYHLAPIMVLAIGSLLFKEKMTNLMYVSMLICFIGTLGIVGANGFHLASAGWRGILYSIISACFYAATMLLGKRITKTSVYATTFFQMVIGLIVLLPFIHFYSYQTIGNSQWGYAITTGVIHTGIVYLLFFSSIRQLPTTVVSFLIFVDPAVAILLDIVVTGTHLKWLQLFGILCIFVGLFYSLKASNHPTDAGQEDYVTFDPERVREQ
ncbi:DMT family transporter [Bacillus sp. Au-Bac7]|uniref:DMT family transporter n=1 Tax=Bacillus sp. Au-Bac7 TaxID=2906458 RepID=UPI001E41EE4B|nr:DMT family transporter [Bacillus sp. Au-Bac7]MCE4052191.1 DMT family transporter [Bacillus sp. Au-Bac7]